MALNNNKETVGFMGNPNVKASGIATKFSKEQVMEYIKCSEDPCYFIEKYCKVVSLDDGIVPFALRPYQKRIIEAVHNNRFTISMLFRQSGKALPLDTEIPTPSGFKKLRDIRIGSVIYGADGKETTVIAESDPKRLEMYRITFDTNESVVACKDHLWTITKSHNGHKETLNTKELVKMIRNGETLYIENTKCVEYPHKETLLTPSRIGELIANGFFDNNDKPFIEDYTNLSKQQRLELLKTLFRLKGVKKESYHITLQNGIARFVLSLLTSLGIKVFVQVNHAKTTLSFKSFEGGGHRVIKSIVRVNDEMGKCIQVDNEDKLFLCTRNYIPTHNSTVMAGYLLWYATFNELKTAVLLANKQSTAIEIFGRVQLMYELLPDWLKQGVVEWNKKSIKFENGSRIFTAASSPSAVRGSSCVSGDTEVCVSINGEVVIDTIDNLFELDYGNPLFDIRIMTEDGFKKFGGFVYQGEREVCRLTFDDGKTLTCTNDHRIRVDNNAPTFVEAQYLSEGDILYGGKIVVKKAEEGGKIAVYDAFEVEDTHTYITNGIVSHNCNLLMLDEFAFLKDKLADEFIASVFPTLSSSKESKLVITSCVTKDTMVFGEDGIRTVGSFVDTSKQGGYYVNDYSVLGKGKFNHGNIMVNSGYVPTKIIKSSHAEIECSYEHKLWACKDGKFGWYKSNDLTEGDWISIQYGMNIWGSNDNIDFDYSKYETDLRNKNVYKFDKITPDLAYLIGLYISEGCIDKHRLFITCGDDISYAFKRLGIKYTTSDNLHYTVCSLSLCDLFRHLGFDTSKKAKEKEIPERLFSMSRENIVAMLQGLFDGDGCATRRGYVTYASASVKLINQIRMLLNNFGILTGKRKVTIAPTKKVKVFSTVYYLEVCARFSKSFFENVGFQLERKQARSTLTNQYKFTRNHYDVIPESANLIRKYHLSAKCGIRLNRGQRDIQRKKLLEIRNLIDDDYWNEYYAKAVSENIHWERICSISESENEVFDFSLNDIPNDDFCHSVIYNGIIGHQTPNGLNAFHKIWKEAQEGINDFVAVRGWWQELHSEEWAKKQYNLLGDVKYKAEIECEFLGSSHTLIDGAKIGKLPITKPLSTANNVSVYEFPNKNSKYVCTVDTSRGRGRDYSAFVIFDVTQMPYKIVCTFKDNKISSLEYPSILNAIGRKYNNAVMVIENNDLGESVANSLWFDFEYEEVIWTNKYEISSSGTIGVRTTRKVKQRGCSNIKELVEKDQLVINDERIVEEFGVYVLSSSGLYAASNENINDDLCSCLFLFGWFTDQPYFEEMTNLKPNSEMTKSFAESLNDYLPMGFKLDGTEDYNSHVNTRLTTEQVDLLL